MTALTEEAVQPTVEEVAEYLECSVRTVKSRVSEAGYKTEKGRVYKVES